MSTSASDANYLSYNENPMEWKSGITQAYIAEPMCLFLLWAILAVVEIVQNKDIVSPEDEHDVNKRKPMGNRVGHAQSGTLRAQPTTVANV